MNDLRVALLLTAALALGGCDVTTSANASRGGANVPQSSNTAFNSLIGSKIGASLDDHRTWVARLRWSCLPTGHGRHCRAITAQRWTS